MPPGFRNTLALTVTLAALAAAGCGERTVEVTGKLLHQGKAVTGDDVRVAFVRLNDAGERTDPPHSAKVDSAAGTFAVTVPAGKYRIAIVQYDANLTDRFKERFGEGSSKIVRRLDAAQELVLDLAKE